jgi:RIO-like serine/threonine protein kinase
MNDFDTPQASISALSDPVALSYTCKLCERMGTAHYEREFVRECEAWKHLLHCNRCGDFRNRISRLKERLKFAAQVFWIEMAKSSAKRNSKVLDALENKFVDLTKAVATITARQWRVQNIWEYDFVQQIKDHPGKAEKIVDTYCAMIKRMATKA